MTEREPAPHVGSPAPRRPTARSQWQRLRPFLRRGSGSSWSTLGWTVAWVGASWITALLVIGALTSLDSQAAHRLRIALGLEHPTAVCNGGGQPACSYDDVEQRVAMVDYAVDRRIRGAILEDLSLRLDGLDASAAVASDKLAEGELVLLRNLDFGGDTTFAAALTRVVDLRPLVPREEVLRRIDDLRSASRTDDVLASAHGMTAREQMAVAIDAHRDWIARQRARIAALDAAEASAWASTGTVDRVAIGRAWWAPGASIDDKAFVANWLLDGGDAAGVSAALVDATSLFPDEVAAAITSPRHRVWGTRLVDDVTCIVGERCASFQPMVRYRSPVSLSQGLGVVGTTLLALASLLLLVVGPVTTAIQVARERQAGTLPVLRMTGLDATDLALAFVVAPNAFAIVGGVSSALLGGLLLTLTTGCALGLVPVALLLALSITTHLLAIAVGDALGLRLDAIVVGALVGAALLVPGLVGTVLATSGLAAAGLLLGPLPAVLAPVLAPDAALLGAGSHDAVADGALSWLGRGSLGPLLLCVSVTLQALAAMACASSFSRRVEAPWGAMFRPAEGFALAVAFIGAIALTLLDVAARIALRSYDDVNFAASVAAALIVPVIGAFVVMSLPRPERANAVPSLAETRRAFLRLQWVLVAAVAALGGVYLAILHGSGLALDGHVVMYATLTQGLLVAETALAVLLLASRRRHARGRVLALGGLVVLAQTAFAAAVYAMEATWVLGHGRPASPLLVGMGVSLWWLLALVVLWALGIGIVVAAILLDKADAARTRAAPLHKDRTGDADADADGQTWMH